MAYLEEPADRERIVFRVADRLVNGAPAAQLATLVGQGQYRNPVTGVCSANISVQVTCHQLLDGEPGPELSFIPRTTRTLQADNNTLVEHPSGRILAVRYQTPDTSAEADWQACIARLSAATDTKLQGDYFAWLYRNQPILFEPFIHQIVADADAGGFFDVVV